MKFFVSVVFLVSTVCALAVGPAPYTEGVIFSMRATLSYSGGSLSGAGSVGLTGETGSAASSGAYNAGEGTPAVVWLKPGKIYFGSWNYNAGGAPNASTNINFGGDVSFIAPTGYTLYLDGISVDVAHSAYFAPINSSGSVSGSHNFTLELRPNVSSNSLPAGTFTGIEIGKAISWEVGLGSLHSGQTAGRIVFREPDFSNSPGSRDRLYYVAPSNTGQITVTKDSGTDRLQKIVTPQAVVDLVDEGTGYRIKFSDPASPTSTWRSILVQYASSTLTITETEGSVSRVTTLGLAVVSGNNVWTIQEGNGSTILRTTVHTNSVPASGQRDDTVVVRTGGTSGTIVQKVKYHYEVQNAVAGWGEELKEVALDPDTANLKTKYDYHATSTAYGNYLKVKSITYPTGNWVSFSYYDDWDKRGQLAIETRPYVDTPSTAAAAAMNLGYSTSHSYVADYSGRYRTESATTTNITNVQSGGSSTSPTTFQTRNGRTYTIYQNSVSASSSLSQQTISEIIDGNQAGDFAGLPYAVKRPDGSQDSYAYYYGTYSGTTFSAFNNPLSGGQVVDNATYFRTIVWHGSSVSGGATAFTSYGSEAVSTIYLVANVSTMDVTIRNPAGLVVRMETWVYTGGTSFTILNYEDISYNVAGRMTQRLASNGAKTEYSYVNGRLDYTIDVSGTQTNFSYDEIGRVHTSTKAGVAITGATQGNIVTTYTYDGASNVTQTDVSGGSGGTLQTLTSTAQYDYARRATQQVQFSGSGNSLTTGYAYSSGGKIVQTTLPGGGIKTTETYLDGQLKQVSGSGTVAENYSYSIYGAGLRLTQSYPTGDSTMITKVYADWLGRPVQKQIPGWNGSPVNKYWYYNSLGQLTKQTDPATAPTLYEYDTMGALTVEGLDINLNGALDRASNDRITQQSHGFNTWDSGATWWAYSQNFVFATSGNGTANYVSTKLTLMNPPANTLAQTIDYDINWNSTTQTTTVNRGAKLITTTTDTPDSSTNAVQSVYNGQLINSTDTTGVQMTYGYDVLGRKIQSTDPRTGSTATSYSTGSNFVAWVTDPAGIFQVINQYDSAGRVVAVGVPNPHYGVGGDTRTALYSRYDYNDRNQVLHAWGEMQSPVAYVYDSLGRQVEMDTYAASTGTFTNSSWPSAPNNKQDTHWNFQAGTGLLSSKVNAAGKSVSYTYTQAAQVYQRTWARGVVTTYSYSGDTGELTQTSYSDGTPTVSNQYNRLGQLSTVTDYTGTRTFNYNLSGTLELQSEVLGSFYGDHKITRGYATTGVVGRYSKILEGPSTGTADYEVDYGYDSVGRPSTVWGVSYGYVTNSHLISTATDTWTSSPQTQTRTYLSTRDAIDVIDTKWSTTSKARFDYGYDSMYRVRTVSCTGDVDMFGRYGNGSQGLDYNYDYDDRSQVTSDVTKLGGSATVLTGRNDSYSFDLLGNRKTMTHNGDTATYTLQANGLNQYDNRTVPGVYDLAGAASTSATVTVNGSSSGVTRQGQYYFKGQALTNTSAPVFTTLTVSDGTISSNWPAFVAKTPEVFTYDDDGNLTSDGQWTYLYDAENRLKWIQTSSAAVGANYPNIAFHIFYDYLGRRVLKYNYAWNTGTGSWQFTGTQKRYLYDGWNLLYELDGSGTNQKCYIWGLDLSGSLQGAGGVGGLLASYDYTSGAFLNAVYDGSGNVVTMLNRNDGSIAAAYEYDAFGKTIRESGPYAATNSFRYSTKYTDLDTGLVYYGRRYYNPSLGRFNNQDPIEESGGLNLFGFCGNNGVNGYDLLGMNDRHTMFGVDHPEWTEEQYQKNLQYNGGYANAHDAGTYSGIGFASGYENTIYSAGMDGAPQWMGQYIVGTDAKGEPIFSWTNPYATGSHGMIDRYFGFGADPNDLPPSDKLVTEGKTPKGKKVAAAGYDKEGNPIVVYYDANGNLTTERRSWSFGAPNSLYRLESSSGSGFLTPDDEDNIRRVTGAALHRGEIHLPSESQRADIDRVISGVGTFADGELRRINGEISKRVYYIDDGLDVPETAENPKTVWGYTHPSVYPNTIFLNPQLFKNSFLVPDLSGTSGWINSLGNNMFHENLHLRFGVTDPGGVRAHSMMDNYIDSIHTKILKELYPRAF